MHKPIALLTRKQPSSFFLSFKKMVRPTRGNLHSISQSEKKREILSPRWTGAVLSFPVGKDVFEFRCNTFFKNDLEFQFTNRHAESLWSRWWWFMVKNSIPTKTNHGDGHWQHPSTEDSRLWQIHSPGQGSSGWNTQVAATGQVQTSCWKACKTKSWNNSFWNPFNDVLYERKCKKPYSKQVPKKGLRSKKRVFCWNDMERTNDVMDNFFQQHPIARASRYSPTFLDAKDNHKMDDIYDMISHLYNSQMFDQSQFPWKKEESWSARSLWSPTSSVWWFKSRNHTVVPTWLPC